MSLINDALKRAKESHEQHPPSPPPGGPLRPVEPPSRNGAPAWLWLVIIFLLVGLGAFLIGQSTRKNGETKSSEPVVVANANTAQPVKAAPEPQPVSVSNRTSAEKAAALAKANEPAIAAVSNTPEVAAKPVTPKLSFKLQSIIYNPKRPSVMINGKLLFVGDSFNGMSVLEITQKSATLVGNGQTNILTLE